jgi:hypothetical protein
MINFHGNFKAKFETIFNEKNYGYALRLRFRQSLKINFKANI